MTREHSENNRKKDETFNFELSRYLIAHMFIVTCDILYSLIYSNSGQTSHAYK